MALLEGNPEVYQLVKQNEVGLGEVPEISAAAKIVVGDFAKAEQWLSSKQWALRWRECQLRYEPIRQVQYWEGTTVPRSSLNVFTVSTVVNALTSKIIEGVFSDDPPFSIQPRKGTDMETARAIQALLRYQIEDCNLRREIESGISDAVLFGTAIWKANWEERTYKRRTYKRKAPLYRLDPLSPTDNPPSLHTVDSDDIIAVEEEVHIGRPVLEHQDLYQVYVDPNCRVSDIREAGWVISRITLSADQLNDMREWEGYDIPSESELEALLFPPAEHIDPTMMDSLEDIGNGGSTHQAQPRAFESSIDPLSDESRFEILERWDGKKVIAVLNRKLVIRDEENPWGRLPYFSVGWLRVPNSFYSVGVGITAGDEQEIQRGIINSMLDEVAYNLNLPILRARGEDAPTQNIRMSLGKFLDVEDVEKSLKQMPRLQAVPEAYAEIQASEARVEASTAANELLVQGNMPAQGRTSIGRTATGANLLAGGSGSRLELFVERLATQVLVPTLDMFFEMSKQLIDMEQLRAILDDEMLQAYEGDHVDILNAKVHFDVLAASRMVVRQRMAQALPMLLQSLLTDPMHTMLTQQGMKVDVNEAINMWFDVVGWKNKASLIVAMTPEDQQRAAASNPMLIKQQGEMAKQKQAGQDKLSAIDADNAGRAYREVQRQVIQHELEQMQIQGTANPNMMGQPDS